MGDVSPRLASALADRYRLERELGAGGMATVYLAEDLKHQRKVAIKVLKPELAAVLGAERFVQEITTTASLSHPHILPLFDSGEADGFLYYVMPYIQGETIRERLNRETQLSVDEAVRITREIADALDYAHRNGVIHRDIKPENLLLHDGRPMVMDFGIALAVSAAAGGRMTETGLSLGTPHYMSPEQATADKAITARSDVYSLASVCYEMLTGNPPHIGSSAQQIIMKIIAERAQPVTELRSSVPSNVAAALARALEKLPADRFDSAAAFARALTDAGYAHATAAGLSPASAARGVPAGRFWGVAAAAVLAVGLAVAGWTRRPEPPVGITRFMLSPAGAAAVTAINADRELAISPDGSHIAYVGNNGTELYLRAMDGLAYVPLLGRNVGARGPFFSPDGQWIGFFAVGVATSAVNALWKVSVAGGVPLPIADVDGGRRGASWGEDGYIVFATADTATGLWRVAADGGPPEQLTTPDPAAGERDHRFPQVLPGATHVLFTIASVAGGTERNDIAVLDVKRRSYRVVLRGGSDAHYVRSGHLVYGVPGALMAQRFDLGRYEALGTPTRVVDSVATRTTGAAQFDIAATGTMVYVPWTSDSGTVAADRSLVWVDRQGRETPIAAPPRPYHMARISPDGRHVALEVRDRSPDLWLWDLVEERLSRFTFSQSPDYAPIWARDGRSIYFEQGLSVVRQATDGSGSPESVFDRAGATPTSISPDGTRLIVNTYAAGGSVWAHTLSEGADANGEPLAFGTGVWANGEVSPDGRWLAFSGGMAGPAQVYVRPFPNVEGGRWQVSSAGGHKPAWSRDGRELFYRDASGAMMRVGVEAGETWKATAPTMLFGGRYFGLGLSRSYDVSPDGRRFLMIKPGPTEQASGLIVNAARAAEARAAELGIIVVQHWDTELQRLVPTP